MEAPKSSTMLGSATATIVEFSGSSIVPSAAVARIMRSLGRSARKALTLLLGLLARGEPLRKRLQEVPPDGTVVLHEGAEFPVRQSPAGELGRGRDRRRARALVDHRELAEAVAWPQARALFAANGHDRLAGVDQEERGTARAFAD